MITSQINAGLVHVTCFANGTVETWLKQRCLKKKKKAKTAKDQWILDSLWFSPLAISSHKKKIIGFI